MPIKKISLRRMPAEKSFFFVSTHLISSSISSLDVRALPAKSRLRARTAINISPVYSFLFILSHLFRSFEIVLFVIEFTLFGFDPVAERVSVYRNGCYVYYKAKTISNPLYKLLLYLRFFLYFKIYIRTLVTRNYFRQYFFRLFIRLFRLSFR